jgi:hypothetical protein
MVAPVVAGDTAHNSPMMPCCSNIWTAGLLCFKKCCRTRGLLLTSHGRHMRLQVAAHPRYPTLICRTVWDENVSCTNPHQNKQWTAGRSRPRPLYILTKKTYREDDGFDGFYIKQVELLCTEMSTSTLMIMRYSLEWGQLWGECHHFFFAASNSWAS